MIRRPKLRPSRLRAGAALAGALVGISLLSCATAPESESPAAERALRETGPAQPAVVPTPRHGVVVGDVTATTALLWSRAEHATRLEVELRGGRVPEAPPLRASAPVTAERDFTGVVRLDGLEPGTRYRYLARLVNETPDGLLVGRPLSGAFRTAPAPTDAAALRLAFGGDVAGQKVCRDAAEGFPVFDVLRQRAPDVFVALGDMIYADSPCPATGRYGNVQLPGEFGPASELSEFWAHWRYAREDEHLRRFLAATSTVAVWDDHEVLNDFGPERDTRYEPPYAPELRLLPVGLRAFLDYNPILDSSGTQGSLPSEPPALYRRLRWGRHLELFVLDTRRYRDPNDAPDSRPLAKSMLGAAQREWLKDALQRSDATWKVVVSSVPISIPTGSPEERGRDGWADYDQDTGFERELRDLLWSSRRVRNQIWITTDVHFGAVFRYTPFDRAPSFRLYEIASGPLNAGVFPKREFDRSLGTERLFFHGPETAEDIADFAEAKRWFNFGELEVDAKGGLTARLVTALGEVVWEKKLSPRRRR